MSAADLSQRFLAFSSTVTAFTVYDLQGSGQAESYLSTVVRVVGEQALVELLDAYDRPASLEAEIFSDSKLGPIARNIIKLWYAGIWYGLPPEWNDAFGARENDGIFTASASAYPEGLLWRAIGANPPGARAPGYGSWQYAPVIPPIPGEEAAAAAKAAAKAAIRATAIGALPQQREPQATDVKETTR
jgi:hypothetical protein